MHSFIVEGPSSSHMKEFTSRSRHFQHFTWIRKEYWLIVNFSTLIEYTKKRKLLLSLGISCTKKIKGQFRPKEIHSWADTASHTHLSALNAFSFSCCENRFFFSPVWAPSALNEPKKPEKERERNKRQIQIFVVEVNTQAERQKNTPENKCVWLIQKKHS